MSRSFIKILALAASSALALTACSSSTDTDGTKEAEQSTDGVTTLVVGASPTPHAEILTFVADNLAEEAGLKLEIKEYTDYVQPNVALDAGELDANYFQHIPYVEEEVATKGYSFEWGEGIHIEPMGIYSESYTSLDEVKDSDEVVIPNDATNGGRALKLLAAQGLIGLDESIENPTVADIKDNPKNLKITESDAAAIPVQYGDAALGVINSNFALENGLNPAEDSIAIEDGKDNPYSNILVWSTDGKNLDAVKKLDELLHSEEVAQFIRDNFDGVVFPAF